MPFHAFISYSHSADGKLAPSLQSKLERFATPWYARRRLRLFRDETTLSATPALWTSIEEALGESEFLVLLASPEAAASRWVGREIEYWLTHKSADRVLLALTGGEIVWNEQSADFHRERSTAIHPSLAGAFAAEPLWVDLRWVDAIDVFSQSDPRFVDAAADLVSAVAGLPKDELVGAELQQRRRARRAILAGVSGIALTAILAIVFAIFALVQREHAITDRNAALSSQLASQSEVLQSDDVALALLLAVESSRVGDETSPAGRGGLVGTLEYSPHLHLFLRPALAVGHPVLSTDNSASALVDVEGAVTLWDPRSGEALPGPEAPLPRLSTAAFNADARLLALGADDGSVFTWDRESGALQTLGSTGTAVDGLAFADDGTTLISAGVDGISSWSVATGARTGTPATSLASAAALSEPNRRLSEETLRRRLVELGGAGPGVAVIAADDAARGTLTWWANAGAQPITLGAHGAYVNDIAISADGTQIATAGADGRVVIWDVPAGGSASVDASAASAVIETHTDSVDAVDFTADGRLLVATSQGYPDSAGMVALYAPDGRQSASFPGHSTQVLSLVVSDDGTTAASAAVDGSVIVWDLRDTQSFLPASVDVSAVAFSPDGSMLMTGSDSGTVAFWSMPSTIDEHDKRERTPRWDAIAAHGDCTPFVPCVSALAFDPTRRARWAASGGSDGGVVRYDLATDPPTPQALSGMGGLIEGLAFSPNGRQLAAVDSGGMIAVWDVASGEVALGPFDSGARASGLDEKFTVVGSRLSSVVYTPDGTLIAAGGRDGLIRFFDAHTGAADASVESSGVSVLAMTFSADGSELAVAGRGGVVDIFAVHATHGRGAPGAARSRSVTVDRDRRLAIGIGGAFTQVVDVAFSPDASLIASTYDTGVLLWDAESGRRITSVLGGYCGLVFAVAFSPNGSTLLVAGNDAEPDIPAPDNATSQADSSELGSVTLRGIGVAEMERRACAIAQRNLTAGEWRRYIGSNAGLTCPAFPVAIQQPVASYGADGEPTATATATAAPAP